MNNPLTKQQQESIGVKIFIVIFSIILPSFATGLMASLICTNLFGITNSDISTITGLIVGMIIYCYLLIMDKLDKIHKDIKDK